MKGIIIYKGKYGATKQYAGWLKDVLNIPLAESYDINEAQLANYGYLVLGTSVYEGRMLIKSWLKKNIAALQGKKIFLFVVSGTPAHKKEILETYLQVNVPPEIRNRMEVYFLPGRLIMKKLSWTDRLMMRMAEMLAKGEEAKKEMRMEYDYVKKENIRDLVNAVRKFDTDHLLKQQVINKWAPTYLKSEIDKLNN
jgi:menaquinone-dependent protoporphyrinogen IX oxidase